ncbi:MAG: GNAT family N-acetyltransferase [Myxococcota bacterium]
MFDWSHDRPPLWDVSKRQIVGAAPRGVFPALKQLTEGALAPGDWWAVRFEGRVVGWGWMDVTWGDAEVSFAVDPDAQRQGVGAFIVDRLDEEAARQGLRYLYNVVPAVHPDGAKLTVWLERQGFVPSGDGGLLRRAVRSPHGPDAQ